MPVTTTARVLSLVAEMTAQGEPISQACLAERVSVSRQRVNQILHAEDVAPAHRCDVCGSSFRSWRRTKRCSPECRAAARRRSPKSTARWMHDIQAVARAREAKLLHVWRHCQRTGLLQIDLATACGISLPRLRTLLGRATRAERAAG